MSRFHSRHIAMTALVSAASMFGLASTSHAANPAPAAAAPAADNPYQDAIKRQYPDAQIKATAQHDVDGTKVYDLTITTPNGTSNAAITQYGDFVLAGTPHKAGDIPPAVKDVTQNLFGAAPSDVDSFIVSRFIVNVTTAGKQYELKLDPLGRVVDIDTKQAIAMEDPNKQPKASGGDTAKLTELVEKTHFPGAKITGVHQSSAAPGFYVVAFNWEGRDGWVNMDEADHIRSWAVRLPEDKTPKPVLNAIQQMKGAKINWIQRYNTYYWEVQQQHNGDTLTLKVRPDGDIISVDSQAAAQNENATTVKHKAPAGAAKHAS